MEVGQRPAKNENLEMENKMTKDQKAKAFDQMVALMAKNFFGVETFVSSEDPDESVCFKIAPNGDFSENADGVEIEFSPENENEKDLAGRFAEALEIAFAQIKK